MWYQTLHVRDDSLIFKNNDLSSGCHVNNHVNNKNIGSSCVELLNLNRILFMLKEGKNEDNKKYLNDYKIKCSTFDTE